MINIAIKSIKRLLLKTLQLFIFSLLCLQLTLSPVAMGSAIAQSQQLPPSTPSPSPEGPAVERAKDSQPVSQPSQTQPATTPDTTPDTRSTKRSGSRGDRPADPYAPYYDTLEKFNEEVYGKNG